MVTQWTTSEYVISRIVRNTKVLGIQDYMNDLPEWIAEGIQKLKTHYQLEMKSQTVQLKFHHARIPCLVDSIEAVCYKGTRLRYGDTAGPMVAREYQDPTGTNVNWQSFNPISIRSKPIEESNILENSYYKSFVEKIKNCPINKKHYYRVNYNKIESDIEEGRLEIWFWTTPVDEKGFPMIPDNEDYQTALYWYCRMMLIGCGVQDPVFNHEYCRNMFELHAGRAIGQITYPTVDQKQRSIETNVRLIPIMYNWDTFGRIEPEGNFPDDAPDAYYI